MASFTFPLTGPLGGDGVAFSELNNISKLLVAMSTAVQSFETAGQQVLSQRTIDNAIGTQLDEIGKVVNQGRIGLDDDTYRRYLRATISTHRSHGTVEDLIKVIDLIIFEDNATYVVVRSTGTALVQVIGVGITDALALVALSFLRRAAATGVRVVLQYGNVWPLYRFDAGPGLDIGHFGGEVTI